MVRADVVAAKVGRANAWLDDAAELLGGPLDEFVADRTRRDLCAFYVFLAIEECIGLAAHWVASAGWPRPDDAAGAFEGLADRDALAPELARDLRAAVGLRNRIAHGYASTDHARLHREAAAGVPQLRRFLLAAAEAAASEG